MRPKAEWAIRELTQRRRGRERERLKSNGFRKAKQQLCVSRVSRFFVHFSAVVARLQRETASFHVLSRTGKNDNNFPFLFLNFDAVH